MTQWAAFTGLVIVVTVLLLVLSHLTQSALSGDGLSDTVECDAETGGTNQGSDSPGTDDSRSEIDGAATETDEQATEPSPLSRSGPVDPDSPAREPGDGESMSEPTGTADSSVETDVTVSGGNSPATTPPEVDPHQGQSSDSGTAVRSVHDDRLRPIEPGSRTIADELSTGALLANVVISQGLFAVLLVGAAIYFGIPGSTLGIEFSQQALVWGVLVGSGLGIVLYVANEIGAASAKRYGIDHNEELRGMLAPESIGGWLVLLVVVLPVIAIFEEFLFRAALIGAISAGYGISPWLLAVVSSVAFALGHGIQGVAGILVTGMLGFVLATAFIVTDSFLVVVVAHYLINALEFVVHEGFDVEWVETTDT